MIRSCRRHAGAVLWGVSMAIWVAATGLSAQEAPDEPTMPKAPSQFRVGLVMSQFNWNEEPGQNSIADGTNWGGEVETVVHPFVSFRLGVQFGRPAIRSDSDHTAADQYTVELLADLRLPLAMLAPADLVPFVTGGYGSVVHAPQARDDLITKNQSAYILGGGLEYDGLPHAGVRAEWRRARVALNDVFDPENRSSHMREADRWVLGVFWRF